MRLALTWVGLMVLLAVTCASSYVRLGEWNTAVNMGISVVKALLIAFVFMELRQAGALLRVVAVAGVLWVAILFGLSWSDFGTRAISRAPWSAR